MKRVKQQFIDLKVLLEKKENPNHLLERMENADIASFLSYGDEINMQELVSCLISIKKIGAVLSELPSEKLQTLLSEMTEEQMDGLFKESSIEDLVYLVEFIPEEKRQKAWSKSSKKEQIQRFLKYKENQTGRIMRSSVFALSEHITASESIERLRERSLEEFVFYIYCIDSAGCLIGVASMRQAATAPAGALLKDLIKKDVVSVTADMPVNEAAQMAAHYDFLALPVVDENRKLLGLITMDDIIDIIQEQNTANIYASAGLQTEERIHTSPWMSLKNRLPWMFLNLLLAVLASGVISLFESTMSRLIILASLKNIVASMGGNTAIQTLTVTTRGMATGDFKFTPFKQAVFKELTVGFFMGILMGLGAAAITYIWKASLLVSVVIFTAMLLNCLMAVLVGSVVPVLLSYFRRDPAVGSGVIVTMITDIFGFAAFLAIASLGLYLFDVHL